MDTSIVQVACKGDKQAFTKLVEHHYRTVYGMAYSAVGDWSAAEDLTQETFLVAWTNLAGLQKPGAFGAWLRQIVRNLASNWRRSAIYRRKLAEHHCQQATGQIATPEACSQLERADQRAEIWNALETLSPKLRETIVLCYLENNSVNEVAEALGTTESTVRKRLQYARGKLRGYFERRWHTEMEYERKRLNPTDASKRFLAILPMGPVDTAISKLAASSSLTSWIQSTISSLLKGGVMMSSSKTTIGAVCLLLVALCVFIGLRESSKPPINPVPINPIPVSSSEVKEEENTDDSVSKVLKKTTEESQDASQAVLTDTQNKTEKEPVKEASGSNKKPQFEYKKIKDPIEYGSVYGRVVDERLRPLPDAEVTVVATGLILPENPSEEDAKQYREAYESALLNNEHYFTSLTDFAGEFSIDDINFQSVARVTASALNYSQTMEVVLIEPGMEPAYLELKLEEGITLEGRVLNTEGAHMSDAKLNIVAYTEKGGSSGGGGSLAEAFGDEEGHFLLTSRKEWEEVTIRVISPINCSHAFPNILVDADQFIELRLPKPTKLHGRIILNNGSPAVGYKIILNGTIVSRHDSGASSYLSGESNETLLDSQGRYRFDSIDPSQEYDVTILNPDGTPVVQNISLQESVEIKAGEESEWNYRIAEAIVLRGKVTGEATGKPLPEIKVSCSNEDVQGESTWAVTDYNGNYELKVFTGTGNYEVSVSYNRINAGGRLAGEGYDKNIELDFGVINELNLVIPELIKRSFLVVDGSGLPVNNASTSIMESTNNMTIGSGPSLTTDEAGRVVIDTLSPQADTWVIFSREGYVEAESEKHVGEPGETVPEEIIIMYRESGLTATLVDTEGNPLVDVEADITIRYGEGAEKDLNAQTDENGVIKFLEDVPATILSVEVFVEREEEKLLTYTNDSIKCEPELVTDLGKIVLKIGDSTL